MSKKANTVIFVIIATILCTLVTVSSFIVILVIYSTYFFSRFPEYLRPWVLPVTFIISISISFFVYRLVIKILIKKVNVEKYLEPIFKKKK